MFRTDFADFLDDPGNRPTGACRPARRSLGRIARDWLDGLTTLVYAGSCLACDAMTSSGPFCGPCREELLETSRNVCPRCALPVGPSAVLAKGCSACRGRPLGFDAALALGPYSGPIRAACLRMKAESGAWLAPWLADLIVERHAATPPAPGIVVPIALHWRRDWARGYNQAEALARRLSERWRLPLAHALRRVVDTPRLADIGRTERARLMRGAFRVRRPGAVAGRAVLLVDDILTTGATCGAASRALKRAGAAHVTAVVVARAEGRS